jgi:hypothetical protein
MLLCFLKNCDVPFTRGYVLYPLSSLHCSSYSTWQVRDSWPDMTKLLQHVGAFPNHCDTVCVASKGRMSSSVTSLPAQHLHMRASFISSSCQRWQPDVDTCADELSPVDPFSMCDAVRTRLRSFLPESGAPRLEDLQAGMPDFCSQELAEEASSFAQAMLRYR